MLLYWLIQSACQNTPEEQVSINDQWCEGEMTSIAHGDNNRLRLPLPEPSYADLAGTFLTNPYDSYNYQLPFVYKMDLNQDGFVDYEEVKTFQCYLFDENRSAEFKTLFPMSHQFQERYSAYYLYLTTRAVLDDTDRYLKKREFIPLKPQPTLKPITWEDLPTVTQTALMESGTNFEEFPAYLENLYNSHLVKVEQGNLHEVARYLHYFKISTYQELRTVLSYDVDPYRCAAILNALENEKTTPETTNEEAYQKLYQKCMAYLERTAGHAMNPLLFNDDPLRSTTHMLFSAFSMDYYMQNNESFNQNSVEKVLIIGPGMVFLNPEHANFIPMQMIEMYAVMDALIKAGVSDIETLEVDVLDINPMSRQHIEDLQARAQLGLPNYAQLYLEEERSTFGGNSSERLVDYYLDLGNGTEEEVDDVLVNQGFYITKNSNNPETHDETFSRDVLIPKPVVDSLNPMVGDVTVHALPTEEYDLVIMLNVFIYLSPEEQILAMANVAQSLKPGGVFLTDEIAIPYANQPLEVLADYHLTYQEDIINGEVKGNKITIFAKPKPSQSFRTIDTNIGSFDIQSLVQPTSPPQNP